MADQLAGLTWPVDGRQVHQGDLVFEQESKANEIINRTQDIIGNGVLSGGQVILGTTSGVKVAATIAYMNGKRIDVPLTDNIAVGADGTKYVVVRHKFNSTQEFNAQGFPLDHRSNSYEILLKTAPAVDDIPLYKITVAAGAVTLVSDERIWVNKISNDPVQVQDLNNVLPANKTTAFWFNATCLNIPAVDSGKGLQIVESSTSKTQIVSTMTNNRLFVRSQISGTWGAWKEFANINGDSSQAFSISALTVSSKASIESFLKLMSSGSDRAVLTTDADGSINLMTNVYESAGVIKLKNTGISVRVRLEGSDGKVYIETFSGNADSTVSYSPPTGQIRQLFPLGFKTGLKGTFQATTLPPTIEAGSVEVKGRMPTLNADFNLTVTDVPPINKMTQSFANMANTWFLTCLSEYGDKYYVPYFPNNALIAYKSSSPITSILIAANIATVTVASTSNMAVGDLVVFRGTDNGTGACDLTGKIVTIPGATSFTVKTNIASGTFNGGTYFVHYPMVTLHGTGSPTGVAAGADVTKYTPTLVYDPTYGGYYVDDYGKPNTVANGGKYRVIQMWFTDNSGNVVDDIITFGMAREKNDNYIEMASGQTSDSPTIGLPFRISIPSKFSKLWGTDVIYADDATNKFRITAQTKLKYRLSCSVHTDANNYPEQIDFRENGVIKKSTYLYPTTVLHDKKELGNQGKLNAGSYIDYANTLTYTSGNQLTYLEGYMELDI